MRPSIPRPCAGRCERSSASFRPVGKIPRPLTLINTGADCGSMMLPSSRRRLAMLFQDRADAGRQLAKALLRYKDQHPVVLALPRGGVVVAAQVAAALEAPLDLVLVRKIGVPAQPELAMGAVVDGATPVIVRNDEVIRACRVNAAEFDAVCARELTEIERRRRRYLGDRKPVDIAGRAAIVVDDGIATGATTRAALRATRE